MLCVSFLSIRKCFHLFVIVVSESLSCAPCEKMDLKIIRSLLKEFTYAEDAGKQECAGAGGFF